MSGLRTDGIEVAFNAYKSRLEEALKRKLSVTYELIRGTGYSDSHTQIALREAGIGGRILAMWYMDTLGSNCGAGIIVNCNSLFSFSKEINELLGHMCQYAAKRAHYGILTATTTEYQGKANTALADSGFTTSGRFRNPNSGNYIQVWYKGLTGVRKPRPRKKVTNANS